MLPMILNPKTSKKLEVLAIAKDVGIDRFAALGRCIEFWGMVCDSADGVLTGISTATIDQELGCVGFGLAMTKVGWLKERQDGVLFIPGFDRYLSVQARTKGIRKAVRIYLAQQREEKAAARRQPPTIKIPTELNSEEFRKAWDLWQTHRKEIRHTLTPTTMQQQLEKLTHWGVQKAIASIHQSIAHGWQGLFEPRKERPQPAQPVKAEPTKEEIAEEQARRRAEDQRAKAERVAPPTDWRRPKP